MIYNDFDVIDKKYSILYSDPPWSYSTWNKSEGDSSVTKTAEKHYPTMDVGDIKKIPVADIAEDDSVMLMWATYPCLHEAMTLMEYWGFEYRTVAFTWVKKNKKSNTWFVGLGHYTRANAEICILGKRGRGVKRESNNVHSVLDNRIEGHSKKPDETRTRIEELFGKQTRIELFARQAYDGWDSWGNQVSEKQNNLFNFLER